MAQEQVSEVTEVTVTDRVKCGCNKWSIGIIDNCDVIVEFGCHPNYGIIRLLDTSPQDLRNLGEMFLAAARKLSK